MTFAPVIRRALYSPPAKLATMERLTWPLVIGRTRYDLGVLHHFQGDLDRAERSYRRDLVVQSRALDPKQPLPGGGG